MRWKLLRRRLSVSSPRVTVRSQLPWPLRWAVVALVFGFSAALALWAFEMGKGLAGLDRDAKEELRQLRAEVARLRDDNARATTIANTAESLLRTERAAQERLAQAVRQLEAESQSLKADLGFFERLLPASGEGLVIRGLQAAALAPGQLRYQMLVMQSGREVADFSGRYEVLASGAVAGKPWSQGLPGGGREMKVRQYARVEGLIEVPAEAVIKTVQVRVLDAQGSLRATQMVGL